MAAAVTALPDRFWDRSLLGVVAVCQFRNATGIRRGRLA